MNSLTSSIPFDLSLLSIVQTRLEQEQNRRNEKRCLEASLIEFVKASWPYIDSSPYQDSWAINALCEHLQAVTEGSILKLLINFPPRCGKPVAYDALVFCKAKGTIPLKEIEVGDFVWTHKGRFRRVLAVHKQGVLPVLKLKTRRGRTVEAAHDHPFLTPTGWVDIGDLKKEDVVGVVPVSEDCGTSSLSNEEARLLGYLVGDGHCGGTPNITSGDDIGAADIVLCIRSIGFEANEQKYQRRKDDTAYLRRVSIKCHTRWKGLTKKGSIGPVKKWLMQHNLLHKSSYTKRIPQSVMRGNNQIVANFIGAYWSCDGYVSTRGTKRDGTERDDILLGCASVNRALMEDIQVLLGRLGIQSTIRDKAVKLKTKKQGEIYYSHELSISTQDDCWRFASLIHMHHTKNAKLANARHRRFDFDRKIWGDTVEEVVPNGEKECICLTVEEDSSFTANGFAVHNTKVVSICYPAWVWARSQKSFWSGPGVRFLCGSYNHTLALTNSTLCRRLILTPWYQARWGKSVVLTTDQNSKYQFDTKEQGSRISTSVGGSLLGIGGDIILIDDPHNTEQVESDADRETATTWWSEIRSTRLNDPQKSAIVVVMQRLHNDDISGLIAQGDDYPDWTHLMLPMRHDVSRHCSTVLKYDAEGDPEIEWDDPRTEEGELLWPQRFGPKEVALLERELGPYMASGRLQQMPVPRGGAIIKREYWQLWPDDEKFPDFEFVLASADTAYTEKEENDPTALTILGIFKDKTDQPRVMLIWAWAKRLELHGAKVERNVGETEKEYEKRSSKSWGLVEWLAYSCRRFHVDLLLIEAKASGITVAQEMQRLHGYEKWMTKTVTPVGDKVSRAHSVEPIFAQGIVFAPDQEYAEKVIQNCEIFPKGKHDDLTDAITQGLQYLRLQGLIAHSHEVAADLAEQMRFKPQQKPLYEV